MENLFEPYNLQFTPEERKMLIARTLKELRQANNLQQKELCKILNIPQTTYNGYEKGRSEPPIETLIRLSFLYKVDMDFITQRNYFYKTEEDAKKQIDEYKLLLAKQKAELIDKGIISKEDSKIFETLENILNQVNQAIPNAYKNTDNQH